MEITGTGPAKPPDALRKAAVELEATFLNEILKAARLGESPEGFGGGTGEEQFTSFLRTEHARVLAEHGGIGLAESIYHAMKERLHD
ncbi:rod-binding protein [uncultured Salipiger sp.]|uniref:rod-binding protein n=1 Tax=uncultured Salipiger sp. TaxID=499810 RepID=UPI00259A0C58|nr:rod-binding protein [uncultured Salipiger sp.]